MGASTFRVNYYVGALLAQGGNVRLEPSKVVFSPTSALDRAMGAVDVEILFQHILGVESKGTLSRSVHIKTTEKTHKFEGGQSQKFWDALHATLPKQGAAPGAAPASAPGLQCDLCLKPLQPGFVFCPHCSHRVKCVCASCHKSVDPSWVACAFCGWKFAAAHAA